MVTRRDFLKTAGATAAAAAIQGFTPGILSAKNNKKAVGSNDKVRLAIVGIGHRGGANCNAIRKAIERYNNAEVVALCDVQMGDPSTLESLQMFPEAAKFKDFRTMFDQMGDKFDAVLVSTPDFSHFPICMRAIREGKHVYCEKPLARTFLENELLIQAALAHPEVVTQLGNQGHSGENYYQFKAWKEAGIIKDVYAVTAHMNSSRRWHGYDTNIKKFPDADPMPAEMEWDTWLSSQLWHDYSEQFNHGNWRSWYDFGMGALGDWGAHLLDTVHEFLELGLPYEIQILKAEGHNDYFFPMSSTIKFRFPRRGLMPACDITWYDGLDNIPELPEGYGESEIADVPTVNGGALQRVNLNPGKIIYSKDLIFKGASHSAPLKIIPESVAKEMEGKLPEVPPVTTNHWVNFLMACQGKEKTRSPFEISGVLCQVFNLGVIGQRLGHGFKFDRTTKEILDDPFANALLNGMPPRKGWEDYYKL